jgi:hypothetical protein
MSESNGPGNGSKLIDVLFRLVAGSALLLGAGSGVYTVNSTDERYRSSEAGRDFALRDERIGRNTSDITWLRGEVVRIDRQGPVIGNQNFAKRIAELERKIEGMSR